MNVGCGARTDHIYLCFEIGSAKRSKYYSLEAAVLCLGH